MIKLWKELKFCWDQIRAGYPRQQEIKDYYALVGPTMSLELKAYTYLECVAAAYTSGVPMQRVADVGCSLFARSNQGTVDMKEIKAILMQNRSIGELRRA